MLFGSALTSFRFLSLIFCSEILSKKRGKRSINDLNSILKAACGLLVNSDRVHELLGAERDQICPSSRFPQAYLSQLLVSGSSLMTRLLVSSLHGFEVVFHMGSAVISFMKRIAVAGFIALGRSLPTKLGVYTAVMKLISFSPIVTRSFRAKLFASAPSLAFQRRSYT
jgi:hypothetical protein